MKALVLDGGLKYVTDYPEPARKKGEALIRVLWAGICRTDLELLKGYMAFRGIPGHEFVGVVEACDDSGWTGCRVVGEINCPCRICPACRRGDFHHCPQRSVLGIQGRDGVFAEYTTLPLGNLHRVPDRVADEDAVFVEPLAAAFRIEEQVSIAPDSLVIVIGDGKLGLLVAQVQQMKGRNVILVGRHRSKLRLAGERGIRTVLAGEETGAQAGYVIDCSGSPAGYMAALRYVRPGGTLVLKSTGAEMLTIDMARLVVNEITVMGSRCGPFPPAIHALATGAVEVRPLVTHRSRLSEGPEILAGHRNSEAIQVLFRVDETGGV